MSSRASQNRAAIDQSVALSDRPRRRGYRSSEWSTDHELELRAFFSGAHVSAAGLHSSLGPQLDRMRDGLGPSMGSACDIPPELRGADGRAGDVLAALARIPQHAFVLRVQYTTETVGRLEGFDALIGGDAWKKSGRPDLRFKLRRRDGAPRSAAADDADQGAETVAVAVAVIAIAGELAQGKSVGGITPECDDVRAELRRRCLVAGGDPTERGGEKPKKTAIEAARVSLGRIGTKTVKLLKRAQDAYAKARSGASAEEVREFEAALDAEADAKYSTSAGAR